jgi:MOSC domain-containing protein YiiM
MSAILVSVQVGRVRAYGAPDAADPREREWRSAFAKAPVRGPVHVGRLGLDGDEQAATDVHGGPEMAVLAYALDHYPAWRAELGIVELGPGGFAENFTVSGMDERAVCVGDVFAVGTARLQVSKPRGPCATISRFWKRPDLLRRVAETGRTGWYLRVLAEGTVEAGAEVRRLERPHPEWTVARVLELRHHPERDREALERLAGCPALAPGWRAEFARLAAGGR